MDLWGPRGCPGQRVLQPRGPTGQQPEGMQCSGRVWRWWVDTNWSWSTADRRPGVKEAVAWNHLQPSAGEKSCAGLVDPPSHLPSQTPSLTYLCSVPGTCGWSTLCREGQGSRLGRRLAYRKRNKRCGSNACQILCITQARTGMLSQDQCILVPKMLRANRI